MVGYVYWYTRVAQKQRNVKFKNVPLSCGYMDQVENREEKSKRLHRFDKYPARSLPFKIADPPF